MKKFTSYSWISSAGALNELLDKWKENNITSIAVDFEGEFNLHIYGEHLCLVQIFDGKDFYLIDPFCVSAEELKLLFENPELEKISDSTCWCLRLGDRTENLRFDRELIGS